MFLRSRLLPVVIITVSIVASACGEPPTREMDQAQGAIDAARAGRADVYAPDEFKAADDALKAARDAVAQRDYRLALSHALESRERAQNAIKQSADQQVTLRSGSERRLGEVTAMLAHANQRLKAAEGGKPLKQPSRQLTPQRAAIANADTTLQKAGTEINDGDYKAAMADLEAAAAQLQSTIAALNAPPPSRSTRSAVRTGRPRK
jgi:hypothetical protein